eukprot:scaffold21019_cov104-Skeletonema_dohrnii-CCMP3373.AAC.1
MAAPHAAFNMAPAQPAKRQHDLLAQTTMPTNSPPPRPLSYRRLQQYSPAHIATAPSRLTSSFVKQAPPLTTAADD